MILTYIKKALFIFLSALVVTAAVSLPGCSAVLFSAASGGMLVADDRRTLGTQMEDREIQSKAVTQLAHRLPSEAKVHIAVFNRRVLLTGEVPQQETKESAEAIVSDIDNVESVVNELAVQDASALGSRSNDAYLNDAYLTAKVKAALVHAQDLSANFFKVVTEHGVVYLMGLVTVEEGQRAAKIASRVSGVLQVVTVFQYIQPQDIQAQE